MHAIRLGSLPMSNAGGVTTTRAASTTQFITRFVGAAIQSNTKAQDSGVSPRVPTTARRRCADSVKRDAETVEPRRSTTQHGAVQTPTRRLGRDCAGRVKHAMRRGFGAAAVDRHRCADRVDAGCRQAHRSYGVWPGEVGRCSCSRAQGGAWSRARSSRLGARRRTGAGASMEGDRREGLQLLVPMGGGAGALGTGHGSHKGRHGRLGALLYACRERASGGVVVSVHGAGKGTGMGRSDGGCWPACLRKNKREEGRASSSRGEHRLG
jgi:hypothetical protein